MYAYLCVRACVRACVRVCVHVCAHACVSVCVCVCVGGWMGLCAYAFVYVTMVNVSKERHFV